MGGGEAAGSGGGVSRLEVCLGFDGSESSDHTAIRAEIVGGWQFTPTYGPDQRPTHWDPLVWGGRIPRGEVEAAVDELHRKYKIVRFYCDPREWQTEIDGWARLIGDEVVVAWPTNQINRMYAALDRAVTDIKSGALTHDGCPVTELHVANARKLAKPGDRYILAKASEAQKIDAAMASVRAHEAAADARAEGWGTTPDHKVCVFG